MKEKRSLETTPKRIQRRRVKGWRMPAGAVYVGRPTRWGNPIPIEPTGRFDEKGRAEYVATITVQQRAEIRRALRGRDLACWCPLVDKEGNPVSCHADVLLEIANA